MKGEQEQQDKCVQHLGCAGTQALCKRFDRRHPFSIAHVSKFERATAPSGERPEFNEGIPCEFMGDTMGTLMGGILRDPQKQCRKAYNPQFQNGFLGNGDSKTVNEGCFKIPVSSF